MVKKRVYTAQEVVDLVRNLISISQHDKYYPRVYFILNVFQYTCMLIICYIFYINYLSCHVYFNVGKEGCSNIAGCNCGGFSKIAFNVIVVKVIILIAIFS